MNQSKFDTDKNLRVNQLNFFLTLLGSGLGAYLGFKLMRGKGIGMVMLGGFGGFALSHLAISKMIGTPIKMYEGNRDISRKPMH